MRSARFACASVHLSLGGLLRQGRRVLVLGLGLASGLHLALSEIRATSEEKKAAKPLTTQFVKRQPRLTKPLELKKRPQPKRRIIQRQMVAVKARTRAGQSVARFYGLGVVGGLTRPTVDIGRVARLASISFEPEMLADAVEVRRETRQRIDTSLELLDVEALDTGQYHALVVQDPTDKRNIRGFFHLARVKSVSMFHTSYDRDFQEPIRLRRGVVRLIEAMNRLTQIKVSLLPDITFDDVGLLKVPWVYSCASGKNLFKITDSEASNLGRYLLQGGFFFSDGWVLHCPLDRSYHVALEKALGSKGLREGSDWAFEPLPRDHPLFHCYFDIDGLPTGHEGALGGPINPEAFPSTAKVVVWDGRLIALHCNKAYVFTWGDWADPDIQSPIVKRANLDNRRQLQFGINTIVFALTQEGSITHRLMESIQ